MLHNVCVCVFNSICVCVFERLEKKRRGTQGGIKRKKRRMKRGVKGWGWKESGSKKKGEGEEANWASVHMHTSPPPIRVTHPPPIRPFLQYITLHFWCLQSSGNEITAHITAAATALKKKREISSAWNAFSYSFFPLMLLLLVFVQWFA